jgi:hypothetical protein
MSGVTTAVLYTASWRAALAAWPEAQPVRISVGCPREAKDAPFIGALAPYGLFGKDLPPEEFAAGYRERLERYGVEGIRARVDRVAREFPGQVLLLACFERRREDCHRGLLADWYEERTGQVIREWEPQSAQLSFDSKEER